MKNHRATGATAVRRGSHRLLAPVIATLFTLTPAAAANADLSPYEQELRTEIMQLAYASQEHIFTSGGYLATITTDKGPSRYLGTDFATGRSLGYYDFGSNRRVIFDHEGAAYRRVPRSTTAKRALALLDRSDATHVRGTPGTDIDEPDAYWVAALPVAMLEFPMMLAKIAAIQKQTITTGGIRFHVVLAGDCFLSNCHNEVLTVESQQGRLQRLLFPDGSSYQYDYGPQDLSLPPDTTTISSALFNDAHELATDLSRLRPIVRKTQRLATQKIRSSQPNHPSKTIKRWARKLIPSGTHSNIGLKLRGDRVTIFIDHHLASDAWRLRWRPARDKVQAKHLKGWQS